MTSKRIQENPELFNKIFDKQEKERKNRKEKERLKEKLYWAWIILMVIGMCVMYLFIKSKGGL